MKENYYPLSKSEEGIYISSLSGGDAYNLAHLVNLGKSFSKKEVEDALNKVGEAHPYLFTELTTSEDGNVVKVVRNKKITLDYEEVKEVKVVSKHSTNR